MSPTTDPVEVGRVRRAVLPDTEDLDGRVGACTLRWWCRCWWWPSPSMARTRPASTATAQLHRAATVPTPTRPRWACSLGAAAGRVAAADAQPALRRHAVAVADRHLAARGRHEHAGSEGPDGAPGPDGNPRRRLRDIDGTRLWYCPLRHDRCGDVVLPDGGGVLRSRETLYFLPAITGGTVTACILVLVAVVARVRVRCSDRVGVRRWLLLPGSPGFGLWVRPPQVDVPSCEPSVWLAVRVLREVWPNPSR